MSINYSEFQDDFIFTEEFMELFKDEQEDSKEMIKYHPFTILPFKEIKKEMYSIYKGGQILKKVIKPGFGCIIPSDSLVTVQYTAYLDNEEQPFDSTFHHSKNQSTLKLNKSGLLPGLEISIQSMKKYEKSYYIIHPQLAYGELGCPPRIPPNREILFKIEILDYKIQDNELNESNLKKAQKFMTPEIKKAVEFCKIKQFEKASIIFERVIEKFEKVWLDNDIDEIALNKILSKLSTNLMICYSKLDKPKLVCYVYETIVFHNKKTHYHHAKALVALNNYEDALNSVYQSMKYAHSTEEGKEII